MHLIIAIGCAAGVILNLNDIHNVPKHGPPRFWKGLCWANAVLFGLGGIFNAFQAGQ